MNRKSVRAGLLVAALSVAAPVTGSVIRGQGAGAGPAVEGVVRVRPGIEVLLAKHRQMLAGRRVGLITNPTGVLPDLTHDLDALIRAGVQVVAAFGPEHGVRGSLQAGVKQSGIEIDPDTGIPFYPLYGKDREQIAAAFRESGNDLILFDIQDVGTRFYTYIWTMSDSLEAAALAGIPVVVLDRPNPIGGVAVGGPVLEARFASFVGRYPIALRHGMTAGELARLFNDRFVPEATGGRRARLDVIPMEGWRRSMYFDETGLPWVMPSPNMPTLETALVYPGQGLFEGTNLSEGRGTTRPFELIGAPFVKPLELAARLNALKLPGVRFRAAYFTPTFSKYQGQVVGGVQVHVTDRRQYRPVETALEMLATVRHLYPAQFEWRTSGSSGGRPRYFIDLLAGTDRVRSALDAGESPAAIAAAWQAQLEAFEALRARYLIYPE